MLAFSRVAGEPFPYIILREYSERAMVKLVTGKGFAPARVG